MYRANVLISGHEFTLGKTVKTKISCIFARVKSCQCHSLILMNQKKNANPPSRFHCSKRKGRRKWRPFLLNVLRSWDTFRIAKRAPTPLQATRNFLICTVAVGLVASQHFTAYITFPFATHFGGPRDKTMRLSSLLLSRNSSNAAACASSRPLGRLRENPR